MIRGWLLTAAVVTLTAWAPSAEASGNVVTIGTRDVMRTVPWWGDGNADVGMRFQCLWFQKDINHAGYINAVEFDVREKKGWGSFGKTRVLFSHTKKATLEATFDNNYTGFQPVLVLSKDILRIGRYIGWFDIGITPNVFYYNNKDNLLMEVLWIHGLNGVYSWKPKQMYGSVYARRDDAEAGTVQDWSQRIRLHINTMAGVDPTSLGRVKALFR